VLDMAPLLVAADGGAATALAAGHRPVAVIGGMGSLPKAVAAELDPATFLAIPEQDSTDFDKAVRNIQAPLVLAVGFTGARQDHELSVLNALVRLQPGHVVVVGPEDVCFHAPRALSLPATPGMRVSFFPLMAVQGRSEGLKWPIHGIPFAPGGRVGTSNEATGARVTWSFDGPGMLAILPRACLNSVVVALLQDQGETPAAP